MTLDDINVYRQIIGSIMKVPSLLLEYDDIQPVDFNVKIPRIVFSILKNMVIGEKTNGAAITPVELDLEVEKHEALAVIYRGGKGFDFVKDAFDFSEAEHFEYYYKQLKKLSLLKTLQKNNFDISEFYKENFNTLREEEETIERLENSSLEEILGRVESKYNKIKADFLNGGRNNGDAAEGLREMVENFKKTPDIGPDLCGLYFNTACRGARPGKFYLRSASSGSGKSRLAVFDAVKISFPIKWSFEENSFIIEVDSEGKPRQPRSTLFITTEMDREEILSIVLSNLSGVNEDHIITGRYDFGEEERVEFAIKIIEKYRDYFFVDSITDPDLTNVEAMVKKYVTFNNVSFVFFDYIFTSPALINQFSSSKIREDVALGMLSNQLKQLAKDYNIFVSSSTQVNAKAKEEEEFKDESCIRGARSVADKIDCGAVMTRVSEKDLNRLIASAKASNISINLQKKIPTHIFDIYKMRRGKYKNIRIWSSIDLGTGEREDLFVTTIDGDLIQIPECYVMGEEMIFPWKGDNVKLDF